MDDSLAGRLLAALGTLAMLGLMTWAELPPWQRELITRRVRVVLRRGAARLARASGHRAMGRELAGAPEDEAGYGFTERLSRVRDAL